MQLDLQNYSLCSNVICQDLEILYKVGYHYYWENASIVERVQMLSLPNLSHVKKARSQCSHTSTINVSSLHVPSVQAIYTHRIDLQLHLHSISIVIIIKYQ